MTAAIAPDRKVESPKDQPAGSPRDRLRRGPTPKHKDVDVPGLGRFRLRVLKQWEVDEANEPLVRRDADEKGKMVSHFDNRGHRARLLAFALINDDGSNVYSEAELRDGVGAKEVNDNSKEAVDALWKAFDELNVWTEEAKDALGKGSAKATS